MERKQVPPGLTRTFKWFLAVNLLVMMCFFVYALGSLYLLTNAMRVRPGEHRGPVWVPDSQPSNKTSDFDEWRRSIRQSLDTGGASRNLDLLLETISRVMLNFSNRTSSMTRSELLLANLTNLEMRLLHEYAMMTKGDASKDRTRPREGIAKPDNTDELR
ncbi:uncharacterized protein LOC106647787 [Copidosoma floridanum]|uniref:uncharacterized protein LOC106647787 n=1 Tax=Copidosoma floridanum TaxID=29053 RepID=UPI0006C9E595|nr:uncharacterized protein LOC106647787 [Copidosoma floridanum]